MLNQSGYQPARRTATKRAAAAAAMTVAMVLGLLQPVTPAHATNWGSTVCGGAPVNCVSLANNNQHALIWLGDQDIPGIAAAQWWAVTNVYNPTDLVAYDAPTDPLPDVRMGDEPYGNNGVPAWVECPPNNTGTGGAHPNRWCRGQIIRYNSYYYTIDLNTEAKRRSIACHEIGHTVGLKHTTATDSCMYNAFLYPLTLNAHDLAHVNGHY